MNGLPMLELLPHATSSSSYLINLPDDKLFSGQTQLLSDTLHNT